MIKFDPAQPFEVVDDQAFDFSQPYEEIEPETNILGAVKDIGTGLLRAPLDAAASAASIIDDPYTRSGMLDPFIESRRKSQEEYINAPGSEEIALPGTSVTRGEVRGGMSSLGYSGAAMGASFLPRAAAAGVGAVAGSEVPLAGTLTGAAIGWVAGAGAAGTAAYRMDTNNFIREYRAFLENQTDKEITDEEFATMQPVEVAEAIKAHGLHEAGWEGIANMIERGAMTQIFKGGGLSAKALKGLASFVGFELGSETATQIGQTNAEVDIGMRPESQRRSLTSPEDITTSAREVIPATVLLAGVGGGGAYVAGKIADIGKAGTVDDAINAAADAVNAPAVETPAPEAPIEEIIQANQEPPQIYRDQPQEQVTPQPAYTDAEAQAMERAARIRNTMAITPESQAPSPIETERTLAPVRAQEYAPEVPQGAAWNEELQREGEQTKAATEQFKPVAEPLTASTDTLIDTFDEIPVNQAPRTITRKAEGGFYGGAKELPKIIRQKTYTTEKTARNALKLLSGKKLNADEYDVFPATGGWQIRTRDDAAKQKAMAEYNNNLPVDIRDAVIKMESDISQGEVGGNAYNDKSGTTQRYKSTNPDYIQLKTLQAYDKKHGTGLAKIVNKDSIAKVISAVRSGKELTGNNRQVWDYIKEQAANMNKTDTELVSGQEADRITKEGIDIGQKRTVVVGNLNEGDKVVVENKGIPDVVEHKGFDEEGNIILEDGKRFTVDQFDKIDIFGEKKADRIAKTLGKNDKINGITRDEAGDMLADGDEAILSHIREGVKKHGKMAMEDAIRNQEITEVAGVPKEKRGEIKDRIAKLKPQIDEILNGKKPRAEAETAPPEKARPVITSQTIREYAEAETEKVFGKKSDIDAIEKKQDDGGELTAEELATLEIADDYLADYEQAIREGDDATAESIRNEVQIARRNGVDTVRQTAKDRDVQPVAKVQPRTFDEIKESFKGEKPKSNLKSELDRLRLEFSEGKITKAQYAKDKKDIKEFFKTKESDVKYSRVSSPVKSLDDIKSKWKGDVKALFVSEDKDGIRLTSLIVNNKNQGIGTKIMNDIIDYAEDTGQKITLSPGTKDDRHGTTSRNRLVKFYKRFGFIENKGRNKDFTMSDSMFRLPGTKYSRAPKSTNTADKITVAISKSQRVRQLLRDGRIKVVEKSADIPTSATSKAIIDQETGEEILNAAGYVKSTDTIYLSAEAIPSGQEENFLAHESWHRAEEKGNLDPLLGELERLEKMAGKGGKVAAWFVKARESAKYDKGTKAYNSELAAYAVQHYEASPNIIKAWVDKLIAKVKAAIFQTLGVMPKKLDPAFLREIALSGMRGNVESGGGGTVFSRMAKDGEELPPDIISEIARYLDYDDNKGAINYLKKKGIKNIIGYHVSSAGNGKLSAGDSWYGRGEGVYFFADRDDIDQAIPYLALKTDGDGGPVSVIKFKIPIDFVTDMEWDGFFASQFDAYSSFLIKKDIPSRYIVSSSRFMIPSSEDFKKGKKGKFSTDDIRYSRVAPKELEALEVEMKDRWIKGKTDISRFDRMFSTIEKYAEKVPVVARYWNVIRHRTELKFQYENAMLKIGDIDAVKQWGDLSNKDHQAFSEYMVKADAEFPRYQRKKAADGTWTAYFPDKENIKDLGEDESAQALFDREHADNLKDGMRKPVADAIRTARMVNYASFKLNIDALSTMQKQAKEAGIEEPTIPVAATGAKFKVTKQDNEGGRAFRLFPTIEEAKEFIGERKNPGEWSYTELEDPKEHKVQQLKISEVLEIMGDIVGNYFPRVRKTGDYILRAYDKNGKEKYMKLFDAPFTENWDKKSAVETMKKYVNFGTGKFQKYLLGADDLHSTISEMKKKGWRVEISENTQLSEDVFEAPQLLVSMQNLLDSALESTPKDQQDAAEQLNKIVTMEIGKIFKMRGSLSSRLKRKPTVIAGYETDAIKAVISHVKSIAGGLAKRETSEKAMKVILGRDISWPDYKAENEGKTFKDYLALVDERRIDPGKQREAYGAVMANFEWSMRNQTKLDRVVGTMKGLATLKYLGFRLSSPVVNMTNMVTGVPAAMHANGISFARAASELRKASTAYVLKRSAGDVRIFDYIASKGWDAPQFNQDAAGFLQSQAGKGYDKVMSWAMFIFGVTEKFNRAATISAAYRALGGKSDAIDQEIMEKARDISDEAHGVYQKETLPEWAMGEGFPAAMARTGYTFTKFTHNYLLNLKKYGFDGQDKKAATWLLISPAILSGVSASAITPVIMAIAKAMGEDEPEEDFYKWMEENTGIPDRMTRQGIAGAFGIDIRGSLGVRYGLPTTIKELLGAPYSVVEDVVVGAKKIASGEVMEGIEKIIPAGIGAPLKALREYSEGITTESNQKVFGVDDAELKGSGIDAAIRAATFNPARLAAEREKIWHGKEKAKRYSEMKGKIYSDMRKYLIQKNRDIGDWSEILMKVEDYNRSVMDQGEDKLITDGQIKSLIKKMRVLAAAEKTMAQNKMAKFKAYEKKAKSDRKRKREEIEYAE